MPERIVDLRSDTITRPTEAMRAAMATAPVGDDVYGEDPTVNRLQELAAGMTGMEAALFVPSGTMGNTCALLSHCHPGDEVVLEEQSHMYNWECGNYAAIAGLAVRALRGEHGILAPGQLEEAIRADNVHYPPTTLVCIENSHNNCAGSAWLPEQVAALAQVARQHGLAVHMDGARLFNAAVAAGVEAAAYTRHVESVMLCVSKGLSAPVGSLLCGTRAFVERARRKRKSLGGAMRQAGIVAAAGIVALEQMVGRLAEDHDNARRLCEGLDAIPGVSVAVPPIPTNIANVDVAGLGWSSAELIGRWKEHGVLCNARPPSRVRLVTHRHITSQDVEHAIESLRALAAAA